MTYYHINTDIWKFINIALTYFLISRKPIATWSSIFIIYRKCSAHEKNIIIMKHLKDCSSFHVKYILLNLRIIQFIKKIPALMIAWTPVYTSISVLYFYIRWPITKIATLQYNIRACTLKKMIKSSPFSVNITTYHYFIAIIVLFE